MPGLWKGRCWGAVSLRLCYESDLRASHACPTAPSLTLIGCNRRGEDEGDMLLSVGDPWNPLLCVAYRYWLGSRRQRRACGTSRNVKNAAGILRGIAKLGIQLARRCRGQPRAPLCSARTANTGSARSKVLRLRSLS